MFKAREANRVFLVRLEGLAGAGKITGRPFSSVQQMISESCIVLGNSTGRG